MTLPLPCRRAPGAALARFALPVLMLLILAAAPAWAVIGPRASSVTAAAAPRAVRIKDELLLMSCLPFAPALAPIFRLVLGY